MESTDRGPSRAVGWHQQDISAEIRKRGETIASLSRSAGLTRGSLQSVFYRRWPRGQSIVAQFIGQPLHVLWPQWYGPDDELLPLQGGVNRPAVKRRRSVA